MYDFMRLQMFAEGAAGDGGAAGGAAPTGGNIAADAAQQTEETVADRLRRKGVPESKLSRRAYQQKVSRPAQDAAPQAPQAEGQDAAAEDPEPESAQDAPKPENTAKKPTFEELMQDPDYNKAMQETVKKRLAKSKAAEERLTQLTPTLQKLAQRYGLGEDFTAEELAEVVDSDDSYYEQKAMELGVTPEIAKRLDQADYVMQQREQERIEREKAQEQDQQIRATFDRLQGQIAEMQQKYPGFDFGTELENRQFAYMISPGSGLTLEQAYFAVHRKEILEAERKAAEQRIAATVQANQRRPRETSRSQAATDTATTVDWHKSTPEQREALKARIRRGEKVLPGRGF